MSAIEVLNRRRRIFRYWSQGLTPLQMQTLLRPDFDRGISLVNIKRDVRTMKKWLPTITGVEADLANIDDTVNAMRAKLMMVQERLTQLMFTADNSNAQVGAAAKLLTSIGIDADILTRSGRLDPTRIRIDQEVTENIELTFPEIFAEFGEVFLKDALRRELQRDRRHTEATVEEQVDSKEE
jgi:hypothetical protein